MRRSGRERSYSQMLEIAALAKASGYKAARKEFRCADQTIHRALGYIRGHRNHRWDAKILGNLHLTEGQFARLFGVHRATLYKACRRLRVHMGGEFSPYKVWLLLAGHEVPVWAITPPYKLAHNPETCIDVRGVTGIHLNIPVDIVKGLRV